MTSIAYNVSESSNTFNRGVSQPKVRKLLRELLLALYKKVTSERFAALNANLTEGREQVRPSLHKGETMLDIRIYEIDPHYIDYLVPYAPHLFHNSKKGQANSRKYIGIVLKVGEFDYFAPLSSFKPKHMAMKEGLDFIKVKDYAVINLNNMFPVPASECAYVDFHHIRDASYRSLLQAEYRFIKSIQEKICKNAAALYKHKKEKGMSTSLAKRCNNFLLLEKQCQQYKR